MYGSVGANGRNSGLCIKNNSALCSNYKLRDFSICFLGVIVNKVQGTTALKCHSEVGCYC